MDFGAVYRGELGLVEAMDLAFQLPPGCQTWRSIGGPSAWSDETHVAVAQLDVARIANWQRTEDGAHNRNPPRPLPRPTLADDGAGKSADRGEAAQARARAFIARQEARRRAAAGPTEEGGT